MHIEGNLMGIQGWVLDNDIHEQMGHVIVVGKLYVVCKEGKPIWVGGVG